MKNSSKKNSGVQPAQTRESRKKQRQRMVMKVIAFILVLMMIVMSCSYIFYAFAEPVYAADFFWGDTPLEYRLDALGGLIEEVQENYKDEVDLDTLFTGIYSGLFSALNDPWSGFYTYDVSNTFFSTTDEAFVGIGITFRLTNENEFLIISTIPGGPAYEAGLKTGDIMIRVNGKDLTGLTSEQVQALVKGDAGTYVTITILRNGITENYTLKRAKVVSQNIQSEMLDNNIGYIKITEFAENTARDFKAARLALLNSGAEGLIIDIRDNPGGYLSEVVELVDELIPAAGVKVSSFVQQGKTVETIYSSGSMVRSVKTVLLTNSNTASAAEYMAAALKETSTAVIVGETTYGKGVAQSYYDSGNGTSFKYSNFYFLSPNGNAIDGQGVTPTYAVYSSGTLSEAEQAKITAGLAPMTESKKYKKGEMGLNVYAAQQRLQYLGYDVDLTGVNDEKTYEAIKFIQTEIGGKAYGRLDYTTMEAIENAFRHWLSPETDDDVLAKAVSLFN